jgi:hypothetical protein
MKKTFVKVILFLLVCSVFTSCASTVNVYTKFSGVNFMDPNLPAGEQIILTPTWGLRIYTLDGNEITFGYIQSIGDDIECLVFKPGSHVLQVEFSDLYVRGTATKTVEYDFQKPGFYRLTAQMEGGTRIVDGDKFLGQMGADINTLNIVVEPDNDFTRVEKIKAQMRKKKMDI